MKKITWYYIYTFGIGYLIAKNKAKKHAQVVNNKITVTETIPFEINDLISAIGGKENFVDCNSQISSLKIVLKDPSKVDKEKIKSLGAKGIMSSQDNITCVFGDFSRKLCETLKKNINN